MDSLKLNAKIYAKSALCKDQLACKASIGCDGIEIQLLSELVNGKIGSYHDAEDVFYLYSFRDYNIEAVHAPILSQYGLADVTLEDFVDDDIVFLEQVFKIAEYFGNRDNKMVPVIVHSETNTRVMKCVGDTWKRVVSYVGYLLFKYPHTELLIENVTPCRGKEGNLTFCNNFKFDNVDMVDLLRDELRTDRIGTVLDICHAKISAMYAEAVYALMPERIPEDLSLDNYFRENKGYIKLIHLSDMKGSGYGKGRHGTKLCEENRDFVEEIIKLYNKYGYTCPITLEIEESNLLVCDNYRESKRIIDEYRKGALSVRDEEEHSDIMDVF